MNVLTTDEARKLIRNYLNFGSKDHMLIDDLLIKAYLFTRDELTTVIGDQGLFVTWGLNQVNETGYLGPIITDNSSREIGTTGKFIQTSFSPITKALNIPDICIDSQTGYEIPLSELQRSHQKYLMSLSNNHFLNNDNLKVRGYTITPDDLKAIGLDKEVDDGNKNDKFLLIPMIRDERLPTEYNFIKEFLSVAISYFENDTIQCKPREYCDPCPSACGNFYDLFERY